MARLPTWLLSQANARAHRLLGTAFAAAGVRGYHYRLLAALEESGPASQITLGRRTGIDRSDVVATLNDLEADGLVTRSPDAADRRRNVITITARGITRLAELDDIVADVQESLLAPLTPDERVQLLGLLDRLTTRPI
jgi:DNA-binding MarR family transcriptional regulator